MAKPKISSDWLAGCAGCHMSLLDIDERIVTIAELADLRATPITDLKEPDASGVDVGILEGGINNTHQRRSGHRMRKRCKILVALGDCAVFGGVPAMRNFFTIEEIAAPGLYRDRKHRLGGQNPERSRTVHAHHRCAPCTKWCQWIFLSPAARRMPIRSSMC